MDGPSPPPLSTSFTPRVKSEFLIGGDEKDESECEDFTGLS